jgi:hypothetical protein
MTKVLTAIFGAVITPVLVAILIKWGDPALWLKLSSGGTPATSESSHRPPSNPVAAPPPAPVEMVTPNLQDHFYSYGWSPRDESFVRKDSVDPTLFQFAESPDRIVVRGEKLGLLCTKKEYENYTLSVHFKWGDKTWPPHEERRRWACIVLHATGPDGDWEACFPRQCIALHLHEGETGSLRLLGGQRTIQCVGRVKENRVGENKQLRRIYVGGETQGIRLINGEPEGWRSMIWRLDFPENVPVSEVLNTQGWHPAGDPFRPKEWNKLRIDCNKGTITVRVNQQIVNEITDLTQTRGRICFSSQHAEWHIGRINFEPRPPEKGQP